MAATLSDALDKNTDTINDEDASLILPAGQAFTDVFVYDRPGDKAYWATLAQFRTGLIPPNAANQSPVVTLAISQNGIQVGQSTVFTATATDPDGVIVAGTFTIDGVPVAVLTTGPFTYTYTPTSPNAVGTHQIAFTGLDNGGATATATLPLVVVAAPTGPNPTPQLTFAPLGNKTVGDAAVTLSVTSTNTGAGAPPITIVSSNGAAVALTQSGGTYTATFPAAGTSTLTALQAAGNGYGAGNASQAVTVSPVQGGAQPEVALEINPSNIALGGTSLLFATPISNNSTIASVRFYDGTTQIGQPITSAPWQTSYAPTTTGTHPLTAKATDALGVVSPASNVQNLNVTGPTVFNLTLDPNGVFARDTLTYDPGSQGVIGYNNPVATSPSGPGSSTMYVCYPNLQTIIGQLDFDPTDAGHLCEVVLSGTHYQKNASTGQALAFTNGSVLIGV